MWTRSALYLVQQASQEQPTKPCFAPSPIQVWSLATSALFYCPPYPRPSCPGALLPASSSKPGSVWPCRRARPPAVCPARVRDPTSPQEAKSRRRPAKEAPPDGGQLVGFPFWETCRRFPCWFPCWLSYVLFLVSCFGMAVFRPGLTPQATFEKGSHECSISQCFAVVNVSHSSPGRLP